MALIAENYLGTDGTNVTGTLTPTGTTGGSVQYNADRCRIVTTTGAFATKRRSITGLANGDAIFTLQLNTTSPVPEHYIDIVARANNATSSLTAGYQLTLSPQAGTNLIELYDLADDAENAADSASFTFAASGIYRVRFRWNGSLIQARIWLASDAEPTTWQLEITSSATTAAGTFHYAVSAATTARTVYFDDLLIDDLNSPPPTGLTSAAATHGWGDPVFVEDFDDPAATIDDEDGDWEAFVGAGYQGRGTFSRAQISIHDSILTLFATAAGASGSVAYYPNPEVRFQRWEALIRDPYGDGLWHAADLLWPLDNVWVGGGEVDWREVATATGISDSSTGAASEVEFNLHYPLDGNQDDDSEDPANDAQVQDSQTGIDLREWHLYAVELAPDGVRGYIDGVLFFESTDLDTIPPRPMRLGLQLDWYDDNTPEETRRPAAHQVAWVKQYALDAVSDPAARTRGFIPLLLA